MKNLKIQSKMFLSFAVVVVLCLAVGVVGVISLKQVDNADTMLYQENTAPMASLAQVSHAFSEERLSLTNLLVFALEDPNSSMVSEELSLLSSLESDYANAFADYKSTIPSSATDELAAANKLDSMYKQDFEAAKEIVLSAVNGGDFSAIAASGEEVFYVGEEISLLLNDLVSQNETEAAHRSESNSTLADRMSTLMIALVVISVVIAVALAFLTTRAIAPPIRRIMGVASQAGNTGNLNFSDDVVSGIKADAVYKDEIGQTALAFASMMDTIIGQAKVLEQVAAGDLTVTVQKAGPQDTLGNSVEAMLNNLNGMFGKVNMSTEQVSAGSNQIADGAQALSQGATEQASAVEELSAAISEVLTQTRSNTQNANGALEAVTEASRLMEGTIAYMTQMQSAMSGIASSSEEISKIIKVIDDIAFQTNILALNAAVEAARAGQHGKGFAVVADEVRNLASKSADAAKETSALIQKSLDSVSLGNDLVSKTSESIEGVATQAGRTQALIVEINSASLQQETAIVQINTGIEQVSQVVQTNSATAEESAASSEELSAQAQMLKGLVARFKLNRNAAVTMEDPYESSSYSAAPSYTSSYSAPSSGGADRYAFPEDNAY